jgi:hypothetical protein
MRFPATWIAICCAGGAATALTAQDQGPRTTMAWNGDAGRSAHAFRRLRVPGEQVEQNVEKLVSELRWYSNLRAARAAGKAKDKPVVWIQALGEIDGFL